MTADEIRKHVDVIIENTFNRLRYAYLRSTKPYESEELKKLEKEGHFTRLIFPRYRSGKLRISEQELRFAFAEEFRDSAYAKDNHLRYSIETPTQEIYSFSDGNPRVVTENGNTYINSDDEKRGFKSGNFDFVIHDESLKRICLIEFKGDCRSPKAYYKDFEKLIHDMEANNTMVRYFIQLLETKESVNKIAEKLKNDNNQKKEDYKRHFLSATPKIEYRYYVLEDGLPINTNAIKKLEIL